MVIFITVKLVEQAISLLDLVTMISGLVCFFQSPTLIQSDFSCSMKLRLRSNCNNFGDPLTFHLTPLSGQNVCFLVYVQIQCKVLRLYFVLRVN